jgi:hypothetical protein
MNYIAILISGFQFLISFSAGPIGRLCGGPNVNQLVKRSGRSRNKRWRDDEYKSGQPVWQ